MLYLNEEHIGEIGIDWNKTIDVIENAVKCMVIDDYSQPIKPYLRYRNLKNRIIAMPAFVGGGINMAGIKWIASFPDNIRRGIPRAHSVVILNNSDTGQPVAVINTPLLSIIRTASVSGLMIKYFQKVRKLENINMGIIGWGPIGQYHFKMCNEIFGNCIKKIFIYDKLKINENTVDEKFRNKVWIVNSWNEAYTDSDMVITCTVSDMPYIDQPPKPGSLHLNVSLRDYKTEAYEWFKNAILVDEWEEVCREKTDIEMMHLEKGLNKEGTFCIKDVVIENCITTLDSDTPVMFNPMGMAIFDISMGNYYFQYGISSRVGIDLN